MIEVDTYYISPKFYEEYIKLYVKYITEDYIPCSTLTKSGELVMSLVPNSTFNKFLHILNAFYSKIY